MKFSQRPSSLLCSLVAGAGIAQAAIVIDVTQPGTLVNVPQTVNKANMVFSFT